MENLKNKIPILFFVIFFVVLSLILPFIALVVGIGESGKAEASKFCDFIF